MSDLPPGFTLEDLPVDSTGGMPSGEGLPPGFELSEDKYGGQKAITALEGAAQGVVGPLAPYAEQRFGGVKSQDILGRQEENPISHGLGEAAGLGASMLTGVGEGAMMQEAGAMAQKAAGLAHVDEAAKLAHMAKAAAKMGAPEAAELAAKSEALGKTVTYGHKVGSAAVQQAAEMAVLQGSDELAKTILNDPNTSAESALSNVGMSSALGAGFGAFGAGVASPLWKATAGPRVEGMLNGLKEHLNGNGRRLPMPEEVDGALKTLGIEPSASTKAGMSSNSTAKQIFGDLRRAEKPEVLEGIDQLKTDVSNKLVDGLGITPEAVQDYSIAEHGRNLSDTFSKEYDAKYAPRAAEMAKRDAAAAPMKVSDDARLDKYGQMLERGMQEFSVNSPYYKLYDEYGQRLLDSESIGDIDKLSTEVRRRAKGLANDDNTKQALYQIGDILKDFKESEVLGMGGEGALAERQQINQNYKRFAQMSDELSNHLGTGDFRGAKTLKDRLDLKPETLARKFSIKNNADLIPFLKENFPDTYNAVLQNERKELIKPAILAADKKGEYPIDAKKLSDIINKQMAGNKEYINALLPPETLQKIDAANTLLNSLPTPRDSGTPAGLAKIFRGLPSSAMAAVGALMGHGLMAGALIGEMAHKIGKDAPEAIKLGYLKFLASEQPVKAEGFKAMVDYMHAAYQGEKILGKGIQNVLKSGAQVLPDKYYPNAKQLEKLDKLVAKNQDQPNSLVEANTNSHVGHYLPNHQVALTEAITRNSQYLQSLKPHGYRPHPLDNEIPPTPEQEARYNRALTIAQSPGTVLQHIKDGTLQVSDIKDLNTMYPGVYKAMAQGLSNEMTSKTADEEQIPYKTRVSISLFMGQALDSSMQPESIIAAQPKSKPPMPNQEQPKKGSPSKMSPKSANSYRTPSQAAERDRTSGRAD